MAGNKSIKMLDNTWGGDKRRLGLGTTHKVPGEVSAEDAELLVGRKLAEWVDDAHPNQAPVTQAEIVEIIKTLDPENPEHYTQGGKPRVEVIEILLGDRQINTVQRDDAMAVIAKEG
ncbi:MAG: hypothetical protein OEY01_14370 [Desulfobulbaceae bacterium]|nr:hypothetical protein [Desulfobulbaceae bacterium]